MRISPPLVFWLLLLAACGWRVGHTPVVNDLTHFLPKRAGIAETILVDQLRAGVAARLILMAVEGADANERTRLSRELAGRLRSSPLLASVHNSAEPLSTQAREFLFQYRYALSPEVRTDSFGVEGLRRALQARLAELASPLGAMSKEWLARDPTGEFLHTARAWGDRAGPATQQGVWVSHDGQRALLIAETRAAGFDMGSQNEIIQLIQTSFSAAAPQHQARLKLAGPPVFSAEANATIGDDALRLSALNIAAVTLLLWAVYRSARLLLIGLLPLLSGALAGAAAVSLLFGSIHGITFGFGATLIGVAADYPNHVFTHLEEGETPGQAVRRIWPTLRLGLLTNVIGFAAMLFSGLEGLAQLGVFAVSGLLAAGAVCRWILPVVMPTRVALPHRVMAMLAANFHPPAALRWLPLLAGVAAASWLWQSSMPLWNDDINALSPVPQASKQLDENLRAELGAPDLRKLVVTEGKNADQALALSEWLAPTLKRLQEAGALGGFDLAARYLPSPATQQQRLQAIPDRQQLAQNLRAALAGLPFQDEAFQPFLAEAESAKKRPPLEPATLADSPLALKIAGLLFPLAQPTAPPPEYHGEIPEQHWVALIPLTSVSDEQRVAAELNALARPGVNYLDLKDESSRLLSNYRQEALRLLAGSLLVIALILGIGLRSAAAAWRVLLPMLSAACVTAAIMASASHGLSLLHLISLLLVMGLSLDQALFFNRPAADAKEKGRTLLSLLICNFSAVIAFGILASSSVNILHQIGSTVALGACFALLFAGLSARPTAATMAP